VRVYYSLGSYIGFKIYLGGGSFCLDFSEENEYLGSVFYWDFGGLETRGFFYY